MLSNNIRGPEKFLIISCSLVIVFGCLYFAVPPFAHALSGIGTDVKEFALARGYWGGFVVTFLSNAALIIPIPYGAVLYLLGSVGLNPWVLGLITGVAAGLGEVVSYLFGRGAGAFVSAEQKSKFARLNNLIIRHPRLVPMLIFLFGVTPIPDDIILIPLGLIRYPFWKAIIPDVLGKLIMTTTLAVAGRYSFSAVQNLFGSDGGFWSGIVILLLTIIAIYLTIKIKWERLIVG
jgi:membrane protein YqaA with SNARE-associated domain